MGKTSKTSQMLPSATQSVTSVNGVPVVNSYIDGGTIYTNYNETPEQKALNSYAQNSLLENLPKVNTFLPETIQNLNSQIDAYTKKGAKSIDDIYSPMIKNLQNDSASRFGNLDNSIFLENLNSLESKRADSMATLAENIQSKRNELVNDELQNQYNYLSFLTDYLNNYQQNLYNMGKNNQSGLSTNNSYQTQLYNALNKSNTTPTLSAADIAQLITLLAA
ncbi:MAG: hypothetical protein PHV37_03680 [Candidatus Gastranaerophilales bacterium]|nr:hypothetical protein [Candidatus Gastranaerophilales bacterium]